MWISKKKLNDINRNVADLEVRIQNQQEEFETLKTVLLKRHEKLSENYIPNRYHD